MAKSGLKRDQQRFTYLLLLPAILTIIIFTSLPALTTLSYSFFIGLDSNVAVLPESKTLEGFLHFPLETRYLWRCDITP